VSSENLLIFKAILDGGTIWKMCLWSDLFLDFWDFKQKNMQNFYKNLTDCFDRANLKLFIDFTRILTV